MTFRVYLSSEYIQTIAHMQHHIGVDTIILRVRTTGGIDSIRYTLVNLAISDALCRHC